MAAMSSRSLDWLGTRHSSRFCVLLLVLLLRAQLAVSPRQQQRGMWPRLQRPGMSRNPAAMVDAPPKFVGSFGPQYAVGMHTPEEVSPDPTIALNKPGGCILVMWGSFMEVCRWGVSSYRVTLTERPAEMLVVSHLGVQSAASMGVCCTQLIS
eukprot:COSAG02_NODE_5151_length_4588_cov_2.905324_6_plen_153_part_00